MKNEKGNRQMKKGTVKFSTNFLWTILFTRKEPAGGPIKGTMQPERVAS
jgi:hypothetical protein